MNIVKNESYTLEITDIGAHGEGIGKIDGFAVFVEGACIGDKIKIKMLKVKKNMVTEKLKILLNLLNSEQNRYAPLSENAAAVRFNIWIIKNNLNLKQKRLKTPLRE